MKGEGGRSGFLGCVRGFLGGNESQERPATHLGELSQSRVGRDEVPGSLARPVIPSAARNLREAGTRVNRFATH